MANRYWVGGTGTWNGSNTANWSATSGGASGASVPTAADDVFFNASSGTGTATLNGSRVAKSIDFTGYTNTFSMSSGVSLTLSGSATFSSGMTLSITGATTAFIFNATGTLTSAGKTLPSVTVNGVGITVTLGDALTVSSTNTTALTAGTLALANFTLSTGIFSSSGSSTRAITFGSGNIALTSTTAATTVLSMATATNFTWTGTGGFTRNMAATATVNFGATAGGTASNAPNLTVNAGASALTVTSGSYFKNVIFTGSTSTVTATYNACGNLTLATGGTYTSVVPTFLASGTITSTGKALGSTTVNGSGITVTLADAFSVGTNTLTLTQGTFNAANFNVTMGGFSSSNTNTRTLTMGSGTWTVQTNATAWNTATTTGLTLNANTSTINMTATAGKTFAGGGLTYYNLSQAGSGLLIISGSNTFNDFTNTVSVGSNVTVQFTAGTTQTFTNFTFSCTAPQSALLTSEIPGSTYTLSKASGTVSASRLIIRDSIATGGATWNATNSIDLGNNTGWNITASTGRYWVGGTGDWDGSAGAKWSTSSGGASGASAPGLVDPVYFDASSGSGVVSIIAGVAGCRSLDCTGFTGTLTNIASMSVYGGITLSAGMTYSYTGTITILGSGTITPAGKTFGTLTIGSTTSSPISVTLAGSIIVGSAGGSTTLLTLTNGTFDAAGFDVTVGGFSSSNTNLRTLNMGSGTWKIVYNGSPSTLVWSTGTTTNFTLNRGTSTITFVTASTQVFAGGGLTYYNLDQGGAGALTIQGSNTFNNISNSYRATGASTITFTSGTTQTVANFTAAGAAGSILTINSSTAGAQATLSKSSGFVDSQYLSIRDSNATGGAGWYAGSTSTNVSNNSGWVFQNSPVSGGGMFMMFA